MPFSLTVLFLGRFDPFQEFVTSRQLFVRSCHDGVYSMLGADAGRLRSMKVQSPNESRMTRR
jgi:hypothetical protein